MPGEYGYSPGEMEEIEKSRTTSDADLVKEGAEYKTDPEGNKQVVNVDTKSKLVTEAAPAATETDPENKSEFAKHELSPKEKEEIKTELKRKLSLGLRDLYELLPHDPNSKVEADDVLELIKHTRLEEAIPLSFWRKVLTKAIVKGELHHKKRGSFISAGLIALDGMVGLQTIIEAGDRQLERSAAARRNKM